MRTVLVGAVAVFLSLACSAPSPAKSRPGNAVRPVEYRISDGTTLTGWISRPGRAGDGKLPAVFFLPGGASLKNRGDERFGPRALLESEEVQDHLGGRYVVFVPDYKSEYFGDALEFESIRAAWKELLKQPDVDPDRIAVMGVSHGGFLALLGALDPANGIRAKAIVDVAGVVDLPHHVRFWEGKIRENPSKFGHYDAYGVGAVKKALGWPPDGNEKAARNFRSRSALNFVGNLRVPLLVIHGEHDDYVPFSHTRALVEALDREGKKYELQTLGRLAGNHFLVLKGRRTWGWISRFLENNL